ncbi:MAG: hypothetical protein M0R03_20355 [Novosphingobium sp.]|nr:hypothetical protein [Novosphingobium sp.]
METNNYFTKKNILLLIIVLIIIIIFYYVNSLRYKVDVQENLIISLNDTLVKWKNKDGLNSAKISVLETENTKQFLKLNLKDKENKELQELVSLYEKKLKERGSATIFDTETKYITDTIILTDVNCDNCIISYVDANEWIETSLLITPVRETTNKSRFFLDYKIKNKYNVIIGEEKVSLFKKKTFVEVINLNPYTETTSLRTYQVSKPKEKRWYAGPSIYTGVGNNGFQFGVGLSLGYRLIRF